MKELPTFESGDTDVLYEGPCTPTKAFCSQRQYRKRSNKCPPSNKRQPLNENFEISANLRMSSHPNIFSIILAGRSPAHTCSERDISSLG